MRWNSESDLKRYVAVALVVALAVSPVTAAAGSEAPAGPPATVPSGALVVESEPTAADVYIDGRPAGQTPLQISNLTSGDHRVRLVKSGYLENARVVSVGTAPSAVRVRLTRDAGSRPELAAAQLGGGGGGGGGSKLPLYLALAGGGAVAGILLLKKGSDDSSTPANNAPTIGSFTPSPTTAIVATTTTFTANGAADSDGDPLTFSWDFGDGTPAGTGATTTHVYTTAATRTVTVTVSDGKTTTSATGSLVVKSLSGTWSGPHSCCPGTLDSVVVMTQTGVNLTGSYANQFPSNAGTIAGTVNATTRQVTFVVTITSGGGQFSFTGTANAAVTLLTGVGNNVSGSAVTANSAWTMSRP